MVPFIYACLALSIVVLTYFLARNIKAYYENTAQLKVTHKSSEENTAQLKILTEKISTFDREEAIMSNILGLESKLISVRDDLLKLKPDGIGDKTS